MSLQKHMNDVTYAEAMFSYTLGFNSLDALCSTPQAGIYPNRLEHKYRSLMKEKFNRDRKTTKEMQIRQRGRKKTSRQI